MRVQALLKSTKLNIAGSIILFFLLPIIPVYCIIYDAPNRVEYFSIASIIKINIQNNRIELLPNVISVFPIIALIAVYLFFSLIGIAWSRSDINRKLYNILKPCRSKIIISSIGATTILYFIFDYIAGVYLGISNLPGVLYTLRQSVELYTEVIILPFSLFSMMFFRLNDIFLNIFLTLTRLGYFHCEYPSDLAQKGIFAAVIMYSLIIFDWYIFAGILVTIYSRIKGKIMKSSSK